MESTRLAIQPNVNPQGLRMSIMWKCGELLRNQWPMPLLCQPDYAENTCMLVGGDVGVFPAKVRSQVQCFRGGVLQVELLGIGKAVALTCSDEYICTWLSHQCRHVAVYRRVGRAAPRII